MRDGFRGRSGTDAFETRKTRKTRSILILLTNTGVSSRDFLAGFSRFARGQANWHVRLRHGSDLDDTGMERLAGPSGYDGIVTNEDVFLRHPELADNPRTAVVVFGTYREMSAPAPVVFVQNDNVCIGKTGARYFMQLGQFRTFGFVPTERHHAWADVRADAFREACRTLAMTSLPIRKVAKLCGFPNASHFGALFRRRFGTSSGQWRQS